MVIRQEENSPIGDFFHHTGLKPLFEMIESQVDEFSVDTDDLLFECDEMISKIKELKSQVKKCEQEYSKLLRRKALKDSLNKEDV